MRLFLFMTENYFKQHIDKEFATLQDLDSSLLNESIFVGKDLAELHKKSFKFAANNEFATNNYKRNCIVGLEGIDETQLLQFLLGETIKYLTVEFYMFVDKIYRSELYGIDYE